MGAEVTSLKCRICGAAFTHPDPEVLEMRARTHLGNHAASSGDPESHYLAAFLPPYTDDEDA